MSKDKRASISQFETSATYGTSRSPERSALAEAIRIRDAAQHENEALKQAHQRAKADAFLARRTVEAAEAGLTKLQETARFALADAYLDGEVDDGSAVTDAEAVLAAAQRRAAELAMIEQELSERCGPVPGHSVPNRRVAEAAHTVVRNAPQVRRIVEDFRIAEATFQQYAATLIHLANLNAIPADLVSIAPSRNATRYADPDPKWVSAIAALSIDADAELPE